MIGFVIVLLMLGVWGGLVWTFWEYVLHERSIPGLGLIDLFTLSIFLLGVPLALVGHYAGLRYRLTRTRWRGIRCDLAHTGVPLHLCCWPRSGSRHSHVGAWHNCRTLFRSVPRSRWPRN